MKPRDEPVVQVIFAGRHEFWETLANDKSCPIRGQAATRSVVEPLGEDEVRQYIDYRLHLVGSSMARVMTDAALDSVVRHGQALPGRINRVLDHAFTLGAAQHRARITPKVVDEAVALPQFTDRPPSTRVVAARTVRPVDPSRRGAERPIRRAGITRDVPKRYASLIARRRSGWVGVAAVVVALGLGLTMLTLHSDGARDLMAASVAPRDVAAAGVPVSEAASTDSRASEVAGETVAPPSTEAAELAARTSAENVIAPALPVAVIPTAALPESPHSSGALSAMVAATELLTPSMGHENAVRSDPGLSVTSPAPSPVSRPEVATLSGARATDGSIEERNTHLAVVSPAPEAAALPDGTASSSVSSAPIAARLPPNMLAILLERGAAKLADDDILAARLLFARAASGGSGLAATEVGKTYDPTYLAERHVGGMRPDPAMAASWYRRAIALGDADAEAASLLQRVGESAPQ